MRVVATIPITKGSWEVTKSNDWIGMYFLEVLLDWSFFKGCKGKLYVETMHSEEEGGKIRLAYQQEPNNLIPVKGSEIVTRKTHSVRWELLESGWFDIPEEGGVSCLWVQAKADLGKRCSVALATLVIVDGEGN